MSGPKPTHMGQRQNDHPRSLAKRASVAPPSRRASPMPMTPAAYLDAHAGDLTALLQLLVRLRTVNPPGENYAAITALLVRELRAAGLAAQRFPIPAALLKKHLPRAQHGF